MLLLLLLQGLLLQGLLLQGLLLLLLLLLQRVCLHLLLCLLQHGLSATVPTLLMRRILQQLLQQELTL